MAVLIVKEGSPRALFKLPHMICLNGRPLGILGKIGKDALKPQMKSEPLNAKIVLPEGHYTLRVQSMLKWISSTIELDVSETKPTVVEFDHREFWWNLLFFADIVAWFAQLFVAFENPWNIVYEVISNGAFFVWLIHQFRIKNRYFTFKVLKDE